MTLDAFPRVGGRRSCPVPSAVQALRRRVDELDVQVRYTRRMRWCLLPTLLFSVANTGLWSPCISLPAPGDGSGYCDRLRPLYPWVSAMAMISILVAVYSAVVLVSSLRELARLRERRCETVRLLGAVRTADYGAVSLLEEVAIAAERRDAPGAHLLAELALEHWAEALQEADQREAAASSPDGRTQTAAPEPEKKEAPAV